MTQQAEELANGAKLTPPAELLKAQNQSSNQWHCFE